VVASSDRHGGEPALSTERAQSGSAGDGAPSQSDEHEPATSEHEPATEVHEPATTEHEPATQAHEPATAEQAGPPAPPPVVVPRWVQMVTLPIALLGLYALLRASGTVVLLFIVATLIALLLNPIVTLLHQRWLPRGVAILLVYLSFFVALAAIGFALSSPISNQVQSFQHNLPHIISSANKHLHDLQVFFNKHGVHVQLEKQGKTGLQTLQDKILKGSSSIVSFSGSLLTKVVTTSFQAILIFVLSVYMLVYGPMIGRNVRKLMPPGDGTPNDDYPTLVQHAVAGYIRGQLLFSFVMGTTAGMALYIYGLIGLFPDGRTYALAFGIFLGVMELIPYIGPVLGALPPILVALFTNPISALWVLILFLAVQQFEGHVASPLIFSRAIRINPLIVIFTLLFGYEVYGIMGAIVALPFAAIIRTTVIYLRRHLVLERWGTSSPPV
jgi:putative heme transporter